MAASRLKPSNVVSTPGFIYTEDVNGDGLPDLITGLAHDYGIFWYELKKDGPGKSRVDEAFD